MSHFSLALLVLFFEKAEQTVECLKGFEGSGVPIYLLDNGSSIESRRVLDDYVRNHTNIRIIREPVNIGVGPGRNRLIAIAEEEWLFFVDNDIVVESRDWFKRLAEHIRKNPEIEVFIPRLYNLHENQWVIYSNFEIVGREVRRTPLTGPVINNFPGGAAIIRRSLFAHWGGYDEQVFVGGEDYEFSFRGLIQGQPVKGLLIEDITLVHDHRRARKLEDVSAVLVRYDESSLETSFEFVGKKHGVVFDRGWQVWASRQRCQMGVEKSWLIRGKYFLRKFYKGVKAYWGEFS